MHALLSVLDALERRVLIVQSADDPPVYLPARVPSLISVAQVLKAVRAAGEERFLSRAALSAPQPVDALRARMQLAIETAVGDMTLRELAAHGPERTARDRVVPEEG